MNPRWSTAAQRVAKLACVIANPAIEAAFTKGESISNGWEAVKPGFEAMEQEF